MSLGGILIICFSFISIGCSLCIFICLLPICTGYTHSPVECMFLDSRDYICLIRCCVSEPSTLSQHGSRRDSMWRHQTCSNHLDLLALAGMHPRVNKEQRALNPLYTPPQNFIAGNHRPAFPWQGCICCSLSFIFPFFQTISLACEHHVALPY